MTAEESLKAVEAKNPTFREDLYKEFDRIFPKGWRYGASEAENDHAYWAISGTMGYFEALENTLLKHGLKDVLDFYGTLSWDQGDCWDYDLECILDDIPTLVSE